MYYLIQKNTFKDIHYNKIIEMMERFEFPHQIVDVKPFITTIDFEPIETKNVFCFGSVKMARVAEQYGWNPGSFLNANHDFRVYGPKYGEHMLNSDSLILNFEDQFKEPGYLFFARPCEDTKTFTGQVFTKASWDEFVVHSLKNGHTTTLNENTPVQICKLKDIQREIRCWIIKGKVITASQYKINERVIYQECTEDLILDFAQRMADIYQPAEAFVLDVAMTNGELKIIEINCINCAGFYEADLQKMILALEDNFTQ